MSKVTVADLPCYGLWEIDDMCKGEVIYFEKSHSGWNVNGIGHPIGQYSNGWNMTGFTRYTPTPAELEKFACILPVKDCQQQCKSRNCNVCEGMV
jgi:hypothetical protein